MIKDQIIAIRDKWHTKKHPLFLALSDGSLDIRILGLHQANHAKFVVLALEAFGFLYTRGNAEVKKMCIDNLAEEEGIVHQEGVGEEAREHMEMITNFCLAAGLSQKEIDETEMTPAWWARSLYYRHIGAEEPVGVALAALFTQEGQQPQLNTEITIPALTSHYGFKEDSPDIEFFVAHAMADVEHSQRQIDLAAVLINGPEEEARALECAETICRLRWESASDLYRLHHLNEALILPEGIAA